MEQARHEAALAANVADASIWRWFSYLLEERRIRWRWQFNSWIIHVDRTHVATENTFDRAIREAKLSAERRGIGLLDSNANSRRRLGHSSLTSEDI